MENIQVIGLATLVVLFVRFLTQLKAQDWDGVVKQLIAWASGIGAVVLYAHTSFAEKSGFLGVDLSAASGADLIVFGLSVASLAGGGFLALKAFDGTQSARQPNLVAPRDGADV